MRVKCIGWDRSKACKVTVNESTRPVRVEAEDPDTFEKLVFRAQVSDLRIKVVPKGYNRYCIRHNCEGWEPSTIERGAVVNHLADIITRKPLPISGNGYLNIVSISKI